MNIFLDFILLKATILLAIGLTLAKYITEFFEKTDKKIPGSQSYKCVSINSCTETNFKSYAIKNAISFYPLFSVRMAILKLENGPTSQQKTDALSEKECQMFESIRMAFTEIAFVNRETSYEDSFARFYLTKSAEKQKSGWSKISVKKISTTSRSVSSTFHNEFLLINVTIFISLSAYDDKTKTKKENYSSKATKIHIGIKVKKYPLPKGQVVLKSVLFGNQSLKNVETEKKEKMSRLELSSNGWVAWSTFAKVASKNKKYTRKFNGKTSDSSLGVSSETLIGHKNHPQFTKAGVTVKSVPENLKMLQDELAVSQERQVGMLFFFDATDADEIEWECQLGFTEEGVTKYLMSTSAAHSSKTIFGNRFVLPAIKKAIAYLCRTQAIEKLMILQSLGCFLLLKRVFF